MNNQEFKEEIKFVIPIKLKEGIKIKEFDSKFKTRSFLLSLGDRNYYINQSLYNLIETIKSFNTLEEIRCEYSNKEGVEYTTEEIIVAINELLVSRNMVETLEPITLKTAKNSLFFKFTIFPKKILKPISGTFKFLFEPLILKYAFILLVLFNYFVFLDSFSFDKLFEVFESAKNLLFLSFFIVISIILHEFGHISACRYYGANHGEIGGGIYIRFPVMYSNLTDIWKLPRKERAIVDLGGIYFQLFFNVILFLLYIHYNEILFLYVFQFVCVQILFTLNPFFKFDGYWALSDILGIPNLRRRTYEILEYIFSRYILRRKNLIKPDSFNLERRYFNALLAYTFISNIFLIYFAVSSIFYFCQNGGFLFHELSDSFKNAFFSDIKTDLFESFSKIVILCTKVITIAFFIYFIFITFKLFYKMTKSIIKLYRNDK